MTQPAPPPTLRAIVLMVDPANGGLILQFPPELPLELVLHVLTMANQSVDQMIRNQNGGLIVPRKPRLDGAN